VGIAFARWTATRSRARNFTESRGGATAGRVLPLRLAASRRRALLPLAPLTGNAGRAYRITHPRDAAHACLWRISHLKKKYSNTTLGSAVPAAHCSQIRTLFPLLMLAAKSGLFVRCSSLRAAKSGLFVRCSLQPNQGPLSDGCSLQPKQGSLSAKR
jgi:hypothetical protein